MAHYTRFEIYLPVVYRVNETDSHSGKERSVVCSLDDALVRRFIDEAKKKYQGITQVNPLAPALYKGWWQPKGKKKFVIDFLTYLFGLVRIDETEEALTFFSKWKSEFETQENQDVILLLYFPVQTIGDFLDA
jgi:hypothetical protein